MVYVGAIVLCGDSRPRLSAWQSQAMYAQLLRLARSRCRPLRGRPRPAPFNLNMNNLHRTKRPIIPRISRHPGNLLHQRHRCIVALPKDRIATAQMLAVRHVLGNKKLRSVRIRPRIRIRQPPRTVEQQIRRDLVLKLISRIASPIALRIATLNHEPRNHSMKNSPIVKRDAVLGNAAHRTLPIFFPGGEPNKVLYPDRSFVREENAGHITRSGLDNRGRLTCRRMVHRRLRRWRSLRARLPPHRNHSRKKQKENSKALTHDCSLRAAQTCSAIYFATLHCTTATAVSAPKPKPSWYLVSFVVQGFFSHCLRLHLPAHGLRLAEHSQHIAAQNFLDVIGTVAAIEQRLRNPRQICRRINPL